ncbi:MAG: hypothetical protein OEW77_12925 [Gemmatimonadota bacterium]|nr:hypothetical protein [Gemmatimonadota bacterium]
MITTRREFLDRLAASGIVLAGLPAALGALPETLGAEEPIAAADEWDIKWPAKLNGKIRAVYDVPEIDSGYGVWRASIWANQYAETHKVPVSTTSTAVVLRHNGIMLAMQQAFWDKYDVGKMKDVMHPMTGQMTNRNPALLTAADGLPEPFASFAIPNFIKNGGVVLACHLALQLDVAAHIQKTDGVSPEEATKQARAMLIPGVILQPSGVYAAILAQAAGGAQYVHSN